VRGGLTDLRGDAPITSLGRLSGLLCALLFALSVLMMARIPALERAVGQDQLVRRHRMIGVSAVVLLVLHVALVTRGYAAEAGTAFLTELNVLVRQGVDLIMATVATGLLLLVGLTSIPLVRRRLRYETWHLTHAYAYLGVALAVPHETSLGTELEGSRPLVMAWWATWAVALLSVLVWRVGKPVVVSLRHRLVVDQVVRETADSVSVYVRGRDLMQLDAAPGQFMVWRFLSGRGWSRGHPYSLSAAPTDDQLRITVRDLGDGSGSVARLARGTRVLVEGPYGRMHPGVHDGGPSVLIASGIGITPIRALLERIDARPGEVTVLYRATGPDRLALAAEIDRIAAARGARLWYLIGPRRRTRRRPSWAPESAGTVGDAELLEMLVPGVADQQVFICGPSDWAGAVRQAALDAGVPAQRIHGEFVNW
jgi:predicted ferric reductase